MASCNLTSRVQRQVSRIERLIYTRHVTSAISTLILDALGLTTIALIRKQGLCLATRERHYGSLQNVAVVIVWAEGLPRDSYTLNLAPGRLMSN